MWAVMLVSAWSAAPASAITYSFGCISGNNVVNCATSSQYSVDVTDPGGNQVLFTFANAGPVASSITDIYFDDGTLLGIASIQNGAGTNFSEGASPPNLPSGNSVNPNFATTFSADSNAPVIENGVNPGESFSILFNLLPGVTFAETITALTNGISCTALDPAAGGDCDGTLRIGVHVQSIGNGGSEAFIVNDGGDLGDPPEVPEPATLMLFGTGLGIVAAKVRNRSKKQQTTSIQ